jgi:hypothetical protein
MKLFYKTLYKILTVIELILKILLCSIIILSAVNKAIAFIDASTIFEMKYYGLWTLGLTISSVVVVRLCFYSRKPKKPTLTVAERNKMWYEYAQSQGYPTPTNERELAWLQYHVKQEQIHKRKMKGIFRIFVFMISMSGFSKIMRNIK